jgi:O-antigen/teichoic acid export membrane protein
MFAEQILRMVAGLLVGVWVARYLGPAQFGLFSYSVAFAALFSSISRLGLDSIVVRNLVREPNQRDLYLGTAFWLKLCGALVMLVVVGIAMQLTSSDVITKIYIFIIASGAIFQAFEVVDFYFRSKVLSKFVSICKLTQLLVSSLLKLYLIFIQADLIWFVLVSLMDQLTLAVSFFISYRYQRLGGFYRYFNWGIAKQLLHDSWPLILGGLVVAIYMRIDQIMIKEILGEEAVGKYSAAVRLSELWYFVPVIMVNSLFPSVVNAKNVNEKLYHTRLQRLFTTLVWMAIAFAVPMIFLSDSLITLLYGEAYKEAGQVLMVHAWAGIFVSLGAASGVWYISENLQQYAFYRTLLGAIINVVLNFILIPIYGMIGAALATVAAQSMAALFFDALTKRTRMVFFMKLKTLYFSNLLQRE